MEKVVIPIMDMEKERRVHDPQAKSEVEVQLKGIERMSLFEEP